MDRFMRELKEVAIQRLSEEELDTAFMSFPNVSIGNPLDKNILDS